MRGVKAGVSPPQQSRLCIQHVLPQQLNTRKTPTNSYAVHCCIIYQVLVRGICSRLKIQSRFSFSFLTSLLLSSSTCTISYPQRSSGQAVVTGVFPSPPRYVPSIFIAHRVQHSHCSSIFIECCYLTLSRFPLINFFTQEKVLRVCALGEN